MKTLKPTIKNLENRVIRKLSANQLWSMGHKKVASPELGARPTLEFASSSNDQKRPQSRGDAHREATVVSAPVALTAKLTEQLLGLVVQ